VQLSYESTLTRTARLETARLRLTMIENDNASCTANQDNVDVQDNSSSSTSDTLPPAPPSHQGQHRPKWCCGDDCVTSTDSVVVLVDDCITSTDGVVVLVGDCATSTDGFLVLVDDSYVPSIVCL